MLRLTTQPLSFLQYEVCTLHTALNEHSVLQLEGVIDASHAAQFLAAYDEPLVLHYMYEDLELQWHGIIKDVQITHAYTAIRARVTVYGKTIRFDEQKETRTYMHEASLEELCAAMNSGSITWHGDEAKRALFEPYLIQYEETNWQFLKRVASRYTIPFIVEEIGGQLEIYTQFQRERYHVSTYDKLSRSAHTVQLSILPHVNNQPLYYTGMELHVEGIPYVIEQATYELHHLYNIHVHYHLVDAYRCEQQAHPLAHTMFQATVINVEDPQQLGRIAVCFDWEQRAHVNERFIPWATPFSANEVGFHTLPSLQETVYVTCAGESEQHLVAYLATRTKSHAMLHPTTQYWRTADGTEICLQPHLLNLSLQMDESHVRQVQLSRQGIYVQHDAHHLNITDEQLSLQYGEHALTFVKEAATLTYGPHTLQMTEHDIAMTNDQNQLHMTTDAIELVRHNSHVRLTDEAVTVQQHDNEIHVDQQRMKLRVGNNVLIDVKHDQIDVRYENEHIQLSSKGVEVHASIFTVKAKKIKLQGKTEITS